ncbi:uncharacterized protein LOC120190299 [Hibiscus syriacus]|uniref:uncharacterized protein LOC120190299 n=1 Tax=Hibiscus syriacus TaxID=106335 RepID=UPI0019213ED4|nr:uncharacterized protein LOC120190299 [Hibiscus syriacus]
MNLKNTFGLAVLLTTAYLCAAARPDAFAPAVSSRDSNDAGDAFIDPGTKFGSDGGDKELGTTKSEKELEDDIAGDDDLNWFGGPTEDDFGSLAGGPIGEDSDDSANSIVCDEPGPCYKKKLTCPAKCYGSVNKSGSGFSASAGAGGCSMDCKTCTATC